MALQRADGHWAPALGSNLGSNLGRRLAKCAHQRTLGRIKTSPRVRIARLGTLNGVLPLPPEACVCSSQQIIIVVIIVPDICVPSGLKPSSQVVLLVDFYSPTSPGPPRRDGLRLSDGGTKRPDVLIFSGFERTPEENSDKKGRFGRLGSVLFFYLAEV